VAATSLLPFSGSSNPVVFTVEGRPPATAGEELKANYSVISPDYFRTMGIPLLQGRDFSEGDNDRGADVAMINESMAKRIFGGEDPVGKHLNISDVFRRPCEIVGVVGDVRFKTLTTEPEPEVYVPYLQRPWLLMAFTVRSVASPASIAPSIRSALWSVDRDQPLEEIKPMREVVAKTVAEPRFYTVLLSIFSGVALVLAAVGIYGVASYTVTQRTREIGIRMALGAQQNDIYKLVLSQAMMLALAGVVLGLIGAFALTRVLSSLLVGVSPTDPSTFALIPLLLCVLVLAASYFPARRAIRINPLLALKQE
jgi:putative ABC transport system permease protein